MWSDVLNGGLLRLASLSLLALEGQRRRVRVNPIVFLNLVESLDFLQKRGATDLPATLLRNVAFLCSLFGAPLPRGAVLCLGIRRPNILLSGSVVFHFCVFLLGFVNRSQSARFNANLACQ